MDELGFRPCRECGQRALIELQSGAGRVCARCYVREHRGEAATVHPTQLAPKTALDATRTITGSTNPIARPTRARD